VNTAETRVSYGEVVTKSLVVVGNGMVGQKLLESAVASGLTDTWQIVAFGEECRPGYDRVHLSAYFDGCTEDELRFGVPKAPAPSDSLSLSAHGPGGRASRRRHQTRGGPAPPLADRSCVSHALCNTDETPANRVGNVHLVLYMCA
jgi:hypothetical protein